LKDGFMTLRTRPVFFDIGRMACAIGLALLAISGEAAQASTIKIQDLGAIERTAEAEIRRQAPESTAEAVPLDRRLQLVACDRPLQANLAPNVNLGARVTVRVACTDGMIQWSVSVPVSVSTETMVAVANHAIPMGTTIGQADIRLETRRFPGTVRCCSTSEDAVLGQLVRRSIPADAVIPLDALDRPPAIKRGEVVTVLAAMPGIEIRSSGIALADARSGETVRIRHSTSLKVIQARADTPGVVRVDR
jgi:flagella basal body P-ring formation protein FlgA